MRWPLFRVAVLGASMADVSCGGQPATGEWAMPRVGPPPKHAESAGQAPQHDPRQRASPGDLPETGMLQHDGWWRRDEVEAYQEAASRDLGVLVDFTAVWCLPCVALDREVLGDPRIRAEIDTAFVPIKIDVSEETQANKEQLVRYRVDRLPAIIMLDAQGHELGRIDRYMDAATARSHISQARIALSRRHALARRRAPQVGRARSAEQDADGTKTATQPSLHP
jgi:thiol-disulfide isomerase/thioredoxin